LHSRRALGLAGTEGNALGMLSDLMHEQGDDTTALDYAQDALRVAQMSNSRFNEAIGFGAMGHALIGLGRPEEAAAAHRQALAIRRELDQPHWAADDLAGLARAALSQGNTVEAMTHVEAILAHLEGGGVLDEGARPQSIHLT